jgi:hypothetical protein
VGRQGTPTWPFRFASVDRWLSPALTLGQHHREILVGDLGLDEAPLRALEADQIIGGPPP